MIHLRVVRTTSDLEGLVPRWERLLEVAANAEPVLTPTWMFAWLRTFEDSIGRLAAVAMTDASGQLVGLAFFGARTVVQARVVPFRRLQMLPSGEKPADEICSEYLGVLVHGDHVEAVATELASALASGVLGPWDELVMPALNADDPFLRRFVAELEGRGLAASTISRATSPFARLPSTWEEYLARLPARERGRIRRVWRDFEAWVGEDGYLLRRAASADEQAEGFAILRDLHTARWRGAGAFRSERFVRFHASVMPRLLRREGGALDLLWLVVRGIPIAVLYNIVYKGKVYNYQVGRSVDLPKHLSPGIVIHILAIQAAIQDRCVEYDFLAGDAQYKRLMASGSRSIVSLRVVSRSPRARFLERIRVALKRVRHFRRQATAGSPTS